MRMLRRTAASVTLLLVFALAAPASAATWRTVVTVVAQGHESETEPSYSYAWANSRAVAEVQLGFKVYGSTKRIDYAYEITCWHNGNKSGKSRPGLTRTVKPGAYRWVTVWSRSQKNMCDVQVETALASLGSSTVRTKVRVR